VRWTLLSLLAGLVSCGASSSPPAPARVEAPATSPASAARLCDRVAAPSGHDHAAGTMARPWRTAQRLADGLRHGMTGCLREGTYRGHGHPGYVLRFTRGRVHVRSFPGERARLAGVVYVRHGANHVTVSRVDIEDTLAPEEGGQIPVQVDARDTRLERLDVTTGSRKTCVILGSFDGYGPAVDTVLRDSVLRDCGDPAHGLLDHAIYVLHARRPRIIGNLMFNAATYGVQLYPSAQHAVVEHNIIADSGGGVIFAGDGSHASSGNVVTGNVIAGSTRDYNLADYWEGPVGTENVAQDNCLGAGPAGNIEPGTGFTPQDNRETDPGFVDPATRDYRLRADSGCLDVLGTTPATVALRRQAMRRAP
jgi:hypothetical protein